MSVRFWNRRLVVAASRARARTRASGIERRVVVSRSGLAASAVACVSLLSPLALANDASAHGPALEFGARLAQPFGEPVPAPTVTRLKPVKGPASGGTAVTITGTNLEGATTVDFGTAEASAVTVNSPTSVSAVAPEHIAGTVDVTVTTPGGTSALTTKDHFKYIPSVTSVSPDLGPTSGGTPVTISGTGFAPGAGNTTIKFGGGLATGVSCASTTACTVDSPAHGASTVDVKATVGGAASSKNAPADQFTFIPPPTVTSVAPAQGPGAGGTSVTITGSNLSTASAVKFGATNAASFTVESPTQITAVSPAGSGTVFVTVTTIGGTSTATAGDVFTFLPPSVSEVAPREGPETGGTSVTITGTNLGGATAVKFGTANATTYTIESASQITATAPPGATGTVDVTVTTPGGVSATGTADHFTYSPPPAITSIAPVAGPQGGGTSVTLTGANLAHASAVSFGGSAASSFTINSATSITAVSPAGSGTVDVTVTTPGGTSATVEADRFTYVPPPAVAEVTPNTGPSAGGTSVVIKGANFTGATAVKFGSTDATTFNVNSATSITAVSPAGSGTVDVTVTTANGGTSATGEADRFAYIALPGPARVAAATTQEPSPTVSSVRPTKGPAVGGTVVKITGANLAGATAVKFGSAESATINVNSPTSVSAVAPAHVGGTVDVTVTTPGGTSALSSADHYNYLPSVTGVTPSAGPTAGGATVTVNGTGFATGAGETAFKFGTAQASAVQCTASTSCTMHTPAHNARAVAIKAIVNGATSPKAPVTFTFVNPPVVREVTPKEGPTAGGTTVTITGENLSGAIAVSFGSGEATSFTVNSPTSITATAPPSGSVIAGEGEEVDVTVTTAGGRSSASAADRFFYLLPPSIQEMQPREGPEAGGTAVLIEGSALARAASVKFGSAAASFKVNAGGSITATAPPGTGTVQVTVTTAAGTAGSAISEFTYIPPPAVSELTPNTGPATGGTSVVITGTNFTGATAVKFGATPATAFNVNSATSISAVAPEGSGTVDVTVTTAHGGTSATGPGDRFSYISVP
jgi:large repetitive protein